MSPPADRPSGVAAWKRTHALEWLGPGPRRNRAIPSRDTAHYPLAEGYRPEDRGPRSFPAEELLKHCRPAGVGRVNLIQMSFYGLDNSYMLDMIKLYPDRF